MKSLFVNFCLFCVVSFFFKLKALALIDLISSKPAKGIKGIIDDNCYIIIYCSEEVFSPYKASISIPGAKIHPGNIVEAASLAVS